MMLGGAVAIGFAPIGLRLSEFGPQATAFWRFLFALPLIALVIVARGGRIGRPSMLALAAGTFFGLDITFWHASLVLTSGSERRRRHQPAATSRSRAAADGFCAAAPPAASTPSPRSPRAAATVAVSTQAAVITSGPGQVK
jgi:hypothetical protein